MAWVNPPSSLKNIHSSRIHDGQRRVRSVSRDRYCVIARSIEGHDAVVIQLDFREDDPSIVVGEGCQNATRKLHIPDVSNKHHEKLLAVEECRDFQLSPQGANM